MNVCVIGGGAAGLVAAITAARGKDNVFILERNNKCGKKLLLTGNGRCNFWNKNQDLKYYHSSNIDIFEKIYESKKDEVLKFFDSIGIIYHEKNGYYYPYSNQATAILNALLAEVKRLNIPVYYEELVIDIKKNDNFTITTTNNTYKADKVVLTTGGKSYPKTGSDGSGYQLAQKLGHSIISVLPSLIQVIGQDNFYKDWDKVRSEVNLTLVENGQEIKQEFGEVQFTDYGLSGICIFNLSGHIAQGLKKNYQEEIKINFVPWCPENFESWLDKQAKLLPTYTLAEILEGFLHYKIINLILKLAKIDKDILGINVDKKPIAKLIAEFPVHITGTKEIEGAQVCQGGVPLKEVDPNTLESKIIPGLYFAGEILDVDGDCGGYNLGFAWMSALVAGESKNVKSK